jgi:hypothetical protein
MSSQSFSSRRTFLTSAAAALTGASLIPRTSPLLHAADSPQPPRVVALLTTFFSRSHAHVILENFLEPYLFNGQVVRPDMPVTGMFVDQIHANDMSRDVARQFKIPIYQIGRAHV